MLVNGFGIGDGILIARLVINDYILSKQQYAQHQ